jgi:hypothetical protein
VQQALQERDDLVQRAELLRANGFGDEFLAARQAIRQLDNNMLQLQGAQGVQELLRYNDPRRIAAVYSAMDSGNNRIQFVPRSDGTFNLVANGSVIEEGLSAQQIIYDFRMATDAKYQQDEIQNRRELNTEAFKSGLKINEETARGLIQAASAQGVATINAGAQIRVKGMDGEQYTTTNMGDGTALVTRKDGREVFRYDVSSPNPEIIPPGPTLTRVPGGSKSVSVG